jgi:hypothetical protein
MQMRRIRRSVACRSYVADDIAAVKHFPFNETGRVMIEMRVVVDHPLVRIGFVDRDAARLANEKFADSSVDCREHRRVARRHDVERAMHMAGSRIGEVVLQIHRANTRDGNRDVGDFATCYDARQAGSLCMFRDISRRPRERQNARTAETDKNQFAH